MKCQQGLRLANDVGCDILFGREGSFAGPLGSLLDVSLSIVGYWTVGYVSIEFAEDERERETHGQNVSCAQSLSV